MLLERAEILVDEGSAEGFAGAMADRGVPLLASVPGVKSVKFGRGVENPHKFMFLVEWATLDAHAAFNKSAIYPEFSKLFKPFSKGGAMEHFRMS